MPDLSDEPDLPEDKHLNMGGDLTEALWDGAYHPVWLEDLPISGELRMRLEQWIGLTDDFEYYLPKRERAPFDLKSFTIAGLDIARCLKAELPEWRITYHDEYLWQNMDELFLNNEQCQYDVMVDAPLLPPWHELAKPIPEGSTTPATALEHLPSRQLREAYGRVQAQCPDMLRLRIHRATSWIYRAEKLEDDDADGCFLSLWIALDALHADSQSISHTLTRKLAVKEAALGVYLQKLLSHDAHDIIKTALLPGLTKNMAALVEDHYLFYPYWQDRHGIPGEENWAEQFQIFHMHYREALQKGDILTTLHNIFTPLTVLRSQIVNGGATWQSMANRQVIEPAIALLFTLLPVFAQLMLEHPQAGWDSPLYPVSAKDFTGEEPAREQNLTTP